MNQLFIHNSQHSSDQNGVTLILAVLVLAAITAIAFSLAAIITIEIRSSGDTTRTEPALYAVQAVTEEALFKYKRSVSDTELDVASGDTATDTSACAPVGLNVCTTSGATFNGVSISSTPPVARKFDPAPRVDVVAPGAVKRYLLIDPDKPQFFGHTYDSVSVIKLNSTTDGAAKFIKCEDTCVDQGSPFTLTQNTLVNFPISGTGQYEMAVCNGSYNGAGTCVAGSSTTLLVQVDAVKATTPMSGHWLPLLDETLDVTASYSGLGRKYIVEIPR